MASYAQEQDEMDEEYRRAWVKAPATFKRQVEKLELNGCDGMSKPMLNGMSHGTIELDEGRDNVSYYDPPIVESMVDRLIEHWGNDHAMMIRQIVEEVRKPIRHEMQQEKAIMITRVVAYLIKEEKVNILARIHQLMHAIPRLAVTMGYRSLRESAKQCRTSVTWIKNGRDKLCDLLEIPVPTEGQKKPEAKAKYRAIATETHWRRRRFKAAA